MNIVLNNEIVMLIGNNFNKRCENILLAAGKQSGNRPGLKVSVSKLAEGLKLDRTEIKQTFEYLVSLGFIKIESIGGPLLYGHISLTKKGVLKLNSMKESK